MPHDDPNEWFFEVDEYDRVIGKMRRFEAHDGSLRIHRGVAVLVFDLKKRFTLMQQRSFNKDTAPGSWSCAVCGHVTYTDMYHTTAVREMKEEIGVSGAAVRFITKIFSRLHNECEFNAVFEACIPKNTHLHFDQSEVQKLQWVPVSRIQSFVRTHDVTPLTRQILTELKYL